MLNFLDFLVILGVFLVILVAVPLERKFKLSCCHLSAKTSKNSKRISI